MIVNPVTLNTQITDRKQENFYHSILCIDKGKSKKQRIEYSGNNESESISGRIYTIHTKLMEITVDTIKETVSQNYRPPEYTGVGNGLIFDSEGTSISGSTAELVGTGIPQEFFDTPSPLATEEAFFEYLKNETVNITDPDLTVECNINSKKVEYIAKRMYPLFLRAAIHLATVGSCQEVCPADTPRLFYMCIENCLFNLEFYYN